jgi:branched-chain amino acid transport system substrate-binding protein
MDWGMQIMAGPTTSGSACAAAAECAADGVFMLTPSASDAAVLSYGDNVFQICFSDPNQGKASADYIFNNKLAEKVGVIYDSSSAYSTGIYQTFKAQADSIGLNIETVESFTADNKADLTTQVTKCKEAGCDLLFLPLYTAENAQVLTCMAKIGFSAKVFSCDGMDGILSVEGFDTSLAEGVMLLTPFDATATDDKTQNFVTNYTTKFGIAPNQFAADAYDVGYAIYEACTAMNVTADWSAEEICDAMIQWFTANSFDGITGAGMSWGADGAVSKYPMAVIIENGVYVTPEN